MLKWRQVISWTNADFSTRRISFMKTHFKLINCKSEVISSISVNLNPHLAKRNFGSKCASKWFHHPCHGPHRAPRWWSGELSCPSLSEFKNKDQGLSANSDALFDLTRTKNQVSKMKFLWHSVCVCFGKIFLNQIWICKTMKPASDMSEADSLDWRWCTVTDKCQKKLQTILFINSQDTWTKSTFW